MSRLIRLMGWLLASALCATLCLGALLFLDRQPVVEDRTVGVAERAWAKRWIAVNRPSGQPAGKLITLSLSEREANLIANALIERLGPGRVSVSLHAGQAGVQVSLGLPWDPHDSFLNLELTFVEQGTLPRVRSARLAGVPIPVTLVRSLADRALEAVDQTRLFHAVELDQDRIRIIYEPSPDLLERLGSGFVAEADRPNMLHYQADLAQQIAALPPGRPVALADLLSRLLATAASGPPSEDPVAQNRALILVLAAYVNGRMFLDPAGVPTEATRPRTHPVLLRGRRDLSQHFLTSAALAIQGNDALSSLVGWYKELSDAKGGSGFSFADMAANRSGIRFARLATGSKEGARGLQQVARKGLVEDDFMPRIDGLPEGMGGQRIQAQLGDLQRPDHRGIIQRIDRRIDACRLFRGSFG